MVAQDGPEALNLWPQHRGKIDLLFTDMVMPGGMTGRELADRLLREEPRLRVIYSTGYSADLFSSGIELVEGVNCLFKPYDATMLVRAVKKTFAHRNSAAAARAARLLQRPNTTVIQRLAVALGPGFNAVFAGFQWHRLPEEHAVRAVAAPARDLPLSNNSTLSALE